MQELLLKCFEYLDHNDLVVTAAVCREWAAVSRDQSLVKLLAKQVSPARSVLASPCLTAAASCGGRASTGSAT